VTGVVVAADGAELRALANRLEGPGRRLVGIAGEPGAGKSMVAAALVGLVGARACGVPLDGFHLADVELARQGLLDRKGAPETFDAWGYAALLARLRERPGHVVYAPGFERELEQPLAGAVPVPPEVEVVLTEGNYLLLDRPEWRAARALLDEVWYVEVPSALRRSRLVARHVQFGKPAAAAEAWVDRVDEPNARLVRDRRGAADLVVDLGAWAGAIA
jgi:pantothenate kinase